MEWKWQLTKPEAPFPVMTIPSSAVKRKLAVCVSAFLGHSPASVNAIVAVPVAPPLWKMSSMEGQNCSFDLHPDFASVIASSIAWLQRMSQGRCTVYTEMILSVLMDEGCLEHAWTD